MRKSAFTFIIPCFTISQSYINFREAAVFSLQLQVICNPLDAFAMHIAYLQKASYRISRPFARSWWEQKRLIYVWGRAALAHSASHTIIIYITQLLVYVWVAVVKRKAKKNNWPVVLELYIAAAAFFIDVCARGRRDTFIQRISI